VIINNLVSLPIETERAIDLLEVQLFNNNDQISTNLLNFTFSTEYTGNTYGSSGFPASNCNDGITSGGFQYICSSALETNPTLTIVSLVAFDKVVVYNRLDCCQDRIDGATITTTINEVSKSTTFPGSYSVYIFTVTSSGLEFTLPPLSD
jgi:hypothetical protein